MRVNLWHIPLWFIAISIASCDSAGPEPAPIEEGEELSGGTTTIFDVSVNAFAFPARGLTREQERFFGVGNSFFNQNWVQAPASTTARDGLGPLFNARSCAGCHFKDGRGRPPAFDGERPTGYLVRIQPVGSRDELGGPGGDARYGDQVQDNAILGIAPEATVVVRYREIPGTFEDGTSYSLREPTISFRDEASGSLEGLVTSARVANQMIGLGLLEAVPESTIEALADPNDRDGDGISGRVNRVWNRQTERYDLGRFGWKAEQPTVRQQSAGAFLGDIGITTSLFPDQNCTSVSEGCADAIHGGEPEIIDENMDHLELYASTLAVPGRRNWEDLDVRLGKSLFFDIGCESCHVSELRTGQSPVANVLSNQTIRPYTDLLLHDMGEGLADGYRTFEANGNEWRTPPLWGLGLIETVNRHTELLHDGRARNVEEAILWHGGEAEASKERYRSLSKEDRDAILLFLSTL